VAVEPARPKPCSDPEPGHLPDPNPDPVSIRRCRDDDHEAMLAIINRAVAAYRGVIPADRWRFPTARSRPRSCLRTRR
jgi:hypothetical protein